MGQSTSNPSTLEEILTLLEKSNKAIGLVATLIAAITFSIGNKFLSYASVIVAYISFASFLISRISAHKEAASILNDKGELIVRKEAVYSKLNRISYGVIMLLMTVGVVSWLWVNLWSDYQQANANLDSSQQPVTISPNSTNSGNLPSGGQSNTSDITFSQEQLSIYSCIYGTTKVSNPDIWEITANQSGTVQTTAGSQTVDSVPDVIVKALFLTPRPIVVNKIYIEIDELTAPVSISDLDLHVSPGCLVGGGGPVETIKFKPVEITHSQKKYELRFVDDASSAKLPYQLNAYDALVISVPLKPNTSGLYVFHFVAAMVDFSGTTDEINSHLLRYGLLQTSLSTLSNQVIAAP